MTDGGLPRGGEPEGRAPDRSPGMRALGWVLPGLPRLLRGRRGGVPALGLWLFLWAVVALRPGRVASTVSGGGVDDWIALATVAAGLTLAWTAGNVWREGGTARWRRFARHRQAAMGAILLAALGLSALLTPYLAPHDPTEQERVVETRFEPPSAEHPLGTDRFGRDVLSRVLYGARVSLGIGTVAVLIAVTLGTAVGAAAGYAGGWVDGAAMRVVDLLLSFPRLVLLITVVALFEPSIGLVTLVLGLTGWMGTSRVVRGEVLSVREQPYVAAARSLGFGDGRVLLRHVLPNAVSPVIVSATLGVGHAILAEAALSFLGLGVQPPTPSWGSMVAAGRDVMLDAWWITTFPGLAIVLTVMSFNLVGDGLRDMMDPRHATLEATP